MYLCIDSTERNNHHLILVGENIHKEYISTEPVLLQAIEDFLSAEKISKNLIQGIGVVVGSGSFSCVRMAVTLANAWHYALNIRACSLEKKDVENIDRLLFTLESRLQNNSYILPTYSAPPNIGA